MKRSSLGLLLLVTIASTTTLLFIGYVKSYLDEEAQTSFFIKRYPTFKMQFHDPFANEGDDVPIAEMRSEARDDFFNYCRFRFGIDDDSVASLEKCKTLLPNYLR